MALQVWLPLNGNLNNQGLSNISVTNNGVTSNSNGKIGSTFHFTENGYCTLSSYFNPSESADFSCAYWVKENSNNKVNSFRGVYDCGGFIVGQYGSNFNVYNMSGGCDIYTSIDSTKWNHCCVTFSKNKAIRLYINGELKKEDTATSFPSPGTISYLGRRPSSGTNQYNDMYINDFRIYDHCLSAKEVSEIAKGLVLHYPLNNGGFGAPNLLPKSCIVNRGCTSFSHDPVNNLWNGVAPAGSSVWGYGITFSNSTKISIPKGTTVCFSLEVKPNIDCSCNADVNNATTDGSNPSGNDNDDTSKRTTSGYNLKANIWNKVYWTYTAKNYDLYDANSNWGIKTTDLSNPVTFQIRNIKVEYGNKPTPWIPHTSDVLYSIVGLNNMTEFDCSGYGNDGTKNESLSYSSDSARYSGCYNFTGSDRIVTPNIAFENMDSGTMSFWIKFNNEFKNWTHYVFFANGFNWTGKGHDFIIVANSGNLSTSTTSTNISLDCCSYVSNFTANLNTWYHIVITWDKLNYTIKKYVNGELKSTNNDSTNKRLDTYKASHNYHCIGNEGNNATYAGNFDISDFRIYSTVLSDDAIKQLYNIPISIDKSSNLYAYEFREV